MYRPGGPMTRTALIAIAGVAIFASTALTPVATEAQRVQRIAAIVNDDVVSQYDLQARMRVVIVSSGLRPTAQLQRRLGQQVLRNLIDERLQLQEAKRRNISVTKGNLEAAISMLEKRNGIPKGSFDEFLRKNRLPRDSIVSQLRAEIAWSKLVRRVLVPRVTVGEDEVDETLQRFKQRKGQVEYRVSEIFLTINQPDQDQDVRRTALRLVEELRHGAKFALVARQFSRTASASVGGDLGWLQEATMNHDLAKIVPRMKEGEIAGPITVLGGLQILKLSGKRQVLAGSPADTAVELQQILLPLRKEAGRDEISTQVGLARVLGDTVSGCADHARAAREANAVGPAKLGKVRMGDLAKPIQAAIASLPVGTASRPVRTGRGVAVFMVCDRKEAEGELPTREQIAKQLRQSRLNVLARQFLRDLRSAAVVDLRV